MLWPRAARVHTGRPVVLSWGRETPGAASSAIRVQTYGDALRRHVVHPEAKAAGPDGEPCGPFTTGELSRLRLHVEHAIHIGKESHDLEEVQAGVVPAISAYVHYIDERAEWKRDKGILRLVPRKLLAKWSGLHVRSIKEILNTKRLPHLRYQRILHRIAEKLRKRGPELIKAMEDWKGRLIRNR